MAYNVLVVDDSRTTRTIIAKALRHSGVELGDIWFAGDGLEALQLLEEHWVDIIFADLNMPRLSGVEMVERMAEHDLLATVPVVIVSTEGRQDRIDALLAKGVAAYLRKPFAPAQVAEIAAGLLGSPQVPAEPDDTQEAFFEALEGFAMMVAVPAEDVPAAPERAVVARACARGALAELEIVVATSEDGAFAIAEAALGDLTDQDAADAVGELVNVIAGHLVDSLAGGPYAVGLPEARVTAGDEAWTQATGAERCSAYDLEGAPLLFGVTMKDRW